jgi:hypothetical protein
MNSCNRRNFLYGCGSVLAIPYFESLGLSVENTNFKNMVIVFSPNGMNMNDWNLIQQNEGKIETLSPILSHLEQHQQDIVVYRGLAQTKARANGDGGGDHARSMSTFLTGVQIKKTDGSNISAGISADQIAANFFKNQNRIPSLQLGLESGKTAGNCDSGYSCAYSSTISWSNPHLPLPADYHPETIFNRIYSTTQNIDAKKTEQQKSIIDFSLSQVKDIMPQLSGSDKRKLDEYLNAVRETERSIQLQKQIPKEPDGKREYFDDKPELFSEHSKLIIDLIVLALQTNSTRVITLTLGNEGTNRVYQEIEVLDGHHNLSHHQNDKEKLDKITKINKLHMDQVNYLFSKLKEASILNDTLVAYGCGIEDGNSHKHHDLPILIGGGGIGGGLYKKLPDETPLNNLWLGILNHIGVNINSVKLGDSTDILRI